MKKTITTEVFDNITSASTVQGTIKPKEPSQYLTFLLAEEQFAIAIVTIKEIIQYGQLTTVPFTPSYVRGVINLRGTVVPVIDLLALFGRGITTLSKRTCIVILTLFQEGETHDIGFMTDSVSAVLDIPDENIESPPAFGATVRNKFIEGMVKINQQFVTLLDVDKTFSLNEMAEWEWE